MTVKYSDTPTHDLNALGIRSAPRGRDHRALPGTGVGLEHGLQALGASSALDSTNTAAASFVLNATALPIPQEFTRDQVARKVPVGEQLAGGDLRGSDAKTKW